MARDEALPVRFPLYVGGRVCVLGRSHSMLDWLVDC